ncbi:MAG: hypothetical protein K0A94_11755 [Desulfuromonadales bacterium]|nr:hypothetical protein [Desulfuromonadales bacterium]
MKKEEAEMNKLCRSCIRTCRQPEAMLLLSCPRYKKRPFEAQDVRFKQVELFDDK